MCAHGRALLTATPVSLFFFQALLEAGAKVDAVTNDGWTPLALAGMNLNWSTLAVLVRYGANIDALDPESQTLMHRAAASGDVAVIDYLRSLGACVDVVNADGKQPAQLAASLGHTVAVAALQGASDAALTSVTPSAGLPLSGLMDLTSITGGGQRTRGQRSLTEDGLEDDVFKLIPSGLGFGLDDTASPDAPLGISSSSSGAGLSNLWGATPGLPLSNPFDLSGLNDWGLSVPTTTTTTTAVAASSAAAALASALPSGTSMPPPLTTAASLLNGGDAAERMELAPVKDFAALEQLMQTDVEALGRELALGGLEDEPARNPANNETLLHSAARVSDC